MGGELRDRVVAITGASSGIGAATAVACGRRGMRVGLFARRKPRLHEVAAEVREAGGEAEVVVGDVRDRDALVELVERVTRRWRRLDVMIANAGFGVAAPVAETPPDEVRELFDVNVIGTVWAIQAAWPIFEIERHGHLVLVSSGAAKHGIPANALYSATKAAQANMAEGLRIEAETIGVDVSVVYPVVTETEFRRNLRDHTDGRKERANAEVGGPRQTAEEVAASIVECLESPKFEVYPYRPARLLPVLEAISPTLTSKLLRYPEYYRRQTGRE
ncbi:MAG: SDR family NAD(P)-dependent oxidoreductase [Gemmatimonadota bacterium]|nr:SDR family NAD(P)-dependent oxidoreductase [Gemmatimonadota bacterium]